MFAWVALLPIGFSIVGGGHWLDDNQFLRVSPGLPPNSASQKAAALTAIAALSKRLGSAAVDRDRSPARYVGPISSHQTAPGACLMPSNRDCPLAVVLCCLPHGFVLSCPGCPVSVKPRQRGTVHAEGLKNGICFLSAPFPAPCLP